MRSESFGQLFKKRQSVIAILIVAAILMTSGLTPNSQAADKDYSSTPYRLEHISLDKASRQIQELGLPVQISKVERANTLIVTTSSPADKVKVASVIKLIDSRFPYEVTKLSFNTETEQLPDTATVNAAIEGIEVGTLTNPPTGTSAAKAIIDVSDKGLFSIAPRGLTKFVVSGINTLRSENKFQPTKPVIIEKPAAPIKPVITAAKASKDDTVLRLTETGRSKVNVVRSKPETISVITEKPVGVELTTLSPTLRQLRQAQKELAEAMKNAESDSVNKFMTNKSNADQIEKLAKNDQLDSGLLDEIKKLHERSKTSTKDTKTESTAKMPPAKKASVPTRPKPREYTPTLKHTAAAKPTAPPASDTTKSTRKIPTGKPEPEKKSSPDDELVNILKKFEAMKAAGPNTTPPDKPVNTKPADTRPVNTNPVNTRPGFTQPVNPKPVAPNPVNTRPVRPVNTRPATTNPARPTRPSNAVNPKPAANNSASSADNPTRLTEEELELIITLPTKVKIPELLELVGKQLKLNYMYDPVQVSGEVQLFIHDGKIKVRELYGLVERALKFKGFVMTRDGNLVIVVKEGDFNKVITKVYKEDEDVDVNEAGDVLVTKIFKVEHIDTDTAQKMLADMKLAINIRSIPEYGKMIVMGYAHVMDKIQEALDMIDLPGKKKEFRYRTLQFLTPSQLTPKLETLAQQLGTVSVSVSSTTGPTSTFSYPPPKPGMSTREKQLYEARKRAAEAAYNRNRSSGKSATSTSTIGAATSKSVYLDIDDRTNRILMIGLAESIDTVEKLIETLDVPQKGISIIRQYKIEYVDASMVIDILSELGITAGGPRPVAPTSPKSRTPVPAPTTRGASSDDGPKISLLVETNSLLVNATHEKHEEIATLIAHIDQLNPDERTIKKYDVEHVDTQEVIDTLTELGMISGQSDRSPYSRNSSTSNRTSTGRPTPGRPTTTPAPTTPSISTQFSEPLGNEPQIAILEPTNSLLINATAKQHASIEMIIQFIDKEPDSTPYVIYPLGNLDPVELKKELDVLVDATIEAQMETKTGKSTGGASPSTGTSKIVSRRSSSGSRDVDDRITIVADEETRSLVVYASKKNQQWIGDIIMELDKYRSQVLLDVTLVEISKDNEFNLDLDMVTKAGGLYSGGSFTPITKDGATGISGLIDPAEWGKLIAEAGVTNGSGKAFYADRHIQGLFELMDKKNYGRVLARPSILVKDNQEGKIDATKTIYVGQEKTNTIIGSTGPGNSTSDVTFQDYSSGITLTITPHIASDKLLQLDIELDRTDFDPSDPGKATFGDRTVPKPLNTVSSNVGTTAILPNGATIILGGIETVTQTKGVSKIPILGDIPLLGFLFRGIDESDKQSKLYVFVKANIIKPGDELTGRSDIERISRKKRDNFEADERKFQGLESVPGIKPNPMAPEKILEDDEYLKELKATRPKNYIHIDLD